ncbi:hypothetical protein [Bdellovibrio svalbardensis]|uniref:Type I restriction enzyme HsdR N-terminal domain-containing protein n=1 Tax=Bdellovibrio svalbardensis TaxID=2972972 RepID=A0ABT6DFE8_9BACT|nr:hypothetical protein [Bdellovibrio svalbardensis]MDG0815192.1 type I restriction enzyme HsdR N-terminal domain-containing protein [Bdellovibrio svalbardensis]
MKYFFLLLLTASAAQAKDIQPLFEALRDSGEKYSVVGTVCEQVAKLDMQQIYPAPQYTVITGIQYGTKKRVIGELDVIVFQNDSKKAILVGEVKCYQDPHAGISKAREQRTRFLSAIRSKTSLLMACLGKPCTVSERNFKGIQQFISIGQEGTKSAGFDVELNYSLDDLMALRAQLMECQDKGECARPE